jgi:SAM-dependent methyltransferase
VGDDFGEDDAALFDAFVVPSYLSLFAAAARPLLLVGEAGRVVHLGCRTGYPDAQWLEDMPSTTGVGVDSVQSFLSIASSRLGSMNMRYVLGNPARTGLDPQTFSHALSFHPTRNAKGRIALFAEMGRLLYPGGQALISLPFGDSFQEVLDLLAEYALKHDDAEIEAAFESVPLHRGTPHQLMEELKSAGLSDVGIDIREEQIPFESGRAFVEDPAVRLLILPLVAAWLGRTSLPDEARDYLARAIDKYWSDTAFELKVQIAAVSARR